MQSSLESYFAEVKLKNGGHTSIFPLNNKQLLKELLVNWRSKYDVTNASDLNLARRLLNHECDEKYHYP
jgi:hypothetical protein